VKLTLSIDKQFILSWIFIYMVRYFPLAARVLESLRNLKFSGWINCFLETYREYVPGGDNSEAKKMAERRNSDK